MALRVRSILPGARRKRDSHHFAHCPETFYITEHYVNYPVVLVRLPRISRSRLKDVLALGVRFVTRATRDKHIRRRAS